MSAAKAMTALPSHYRVEANDRFSKWMDSLGYGSKMRIAKDLGCSPSMVGHIANKRRVPSLRIANSIERMSAMWEHGPIRAMEWTKP